MSHAPASPPCAQDPTIDPDASDYDPFCEFGIAALNHRFELPTASSPPAPTRKANKDDIYICQIKTTAGLWAGLLNGQHVARYTGKLAALGGFSCVLAASQDVSAFRRVCTLLDPHRKNVSFGNLQPLPAEERLINRDISAHFAKYQIWTDSQAPLSPGQELSGGDEDNGSSPNDPPEVVSDSDANDEQAIDLADDPEDSSDFAPRPRPKLSRRQARRDREGALGESDAEDSPACSDDEEDSDDDEEDEAESLPVGFDDDHLFKGKRLPRHLVEQARKKTVPRKKKTIVVDDLDSDECTWQPCGGRKMFHYTPAFDFDEHNAAASPSEEKTGTCLVPSTAQTQTNA